MNDEYSIGNDMTMRAKDSSALGRIDQYELVRELGGGGFGCVFLAKDTVAGIEVAVKGLPPEVRHNKEELENIRENFALVSRLHHPNIAAALVLHPAKDVVYSSRDVMEKLRVFEGDTLMVMEYAPGMTLSSWRKQLPGKRVPFDIAIGIVRQIALALDYAHARKIVHRDIKPANVMIESLENGSNSIRILDFGLAAEIRSSMGRVSREIRDMSGTRPYMAPEQWAGEKQGAATDQYALAVLFCELVSGEVPYQSAFESGDSIVMMANVIHQPVKLPEGIPEKIRVPLLRALSKKPSGRYPTCSAFAEALTRRTFPWTLLAAGLLLASAICAAVGWWLSRGKLQLSQTEVESAVVETSLPQDVKTDPVPAVQAKLVTVQTNQPPAVAKVVAKVIVTNADDTVERELKRHQAEEFKLAQEEFRQAQEELGLKQKELERRQAEEALRKQQEAERQRKKAEQEQLERKRQAEEARREAEAKKREEDKRQAEQVARRELIQKLKNGSEFVPNPPVTAAGTERRVALPGGGHMDFVWCPPGRFLMGSPEIEDKRSVDEKQHVVTLTKGFWIGKTEVTRAQWKSVMGDAVFAWTSLWGGDAEFPIDTINWHQCQDFCKKAGNGFRLPTEAEWEYACRAGTVTPFSFGGVLNGQTANCSGGAEPYGTLESGPNSFGSKRVASYQRNPWGIYDMHGNLFEWCADYYAGYQEGDSVDPKGPETGGVRIVRGGCWNFAPKMSRSAFRSRKDSMAADAHTGFRVCCDELQ